MMVMMMMMVVVMMVIIMMVMMMMVSNIFTIMSGHVTSTRSTITPHGSVPSSSVF